jgi:hypothetical protein
LPPYSPNFNTIENAFGKLEQPLRKAAQRTIDGLWTAIGLIVDLITPAECRNNFSTARNDATCRLPLYSKGKPALKNEDRMRKVQGKRGLPAPPPATTPGCGRTAQLQLSRLTRWEESLCLSPSHKPLHDRVPATTLVRLRR